MKTILNGEQIALTIERLAYQLIENHVNANELVIIGLQPRGVYVSDRIVKVLQGISHNLKIQYGILDITFYRDDIRKQLHTPNKTHIPFGIENKQVILIDDVLWTGRTIRAALDALLDFGRPAKVELCVLIDRRFSREFPIRADYVGRSIDTFANQKVKVEWREKDNADIVILLES